MELENKSKEFSSKYNYYISHKGLIDGGDLLDDKVEFILRKQQEFKNIMETRTSALLKKRLEEKTNE